MKRARDDIYSASASQFKRPFASSRGDSYGQSQVPGGGGGAGGGSGGGGGGEATTSQKLTTNDALSYLKQVKDMFQDQREKYDLFLEVMKDFKAQRTDTAGVIARVKELFKGHNHLIFGFNTFLPKGYEITLDEDEAPAKKTVEFEEAISFVNKIKKRFQNDEHVYKSFLDILNMYRKEHKDIGEVYSEVATLFKDHRDLLEEFTRFLPDTSAAPSTQHAPFGRNSLQRFNERNSMTPMMRQMQVDKQRYRRDRLPSHDRDRDLSVEHPEMDDDKTMINLHKEQRKRDRRIRDQDERDPDLDNSRDLTSQRFLDKKKTVKKAEGYGLATDFTSYDDKDSLRGMYGEAFSFCEKVKEKLSSSDDYQTFLKCLNIFNNGIIKKNDLQNLVTDLLGKHSDLMDEFKDFLERCENIEGFLAGVMSKKSLSTDAHLSRSSKLEDKDKDQKREMDGAKEKDRYKEKYMGKSIQELDLSDCKRCTPSYRLLPSDYPIPTASQRSELGAQVLNDHWVSVTSGSEDYSFKHMRKNQYEESLFRCEDDRFELDLLLESVSSASKRAEELYNNINENKISVEALSRIEDHFTVLNLRCIERLYGDHGLDVIDILRKNPTHALPVILTRLKQKQEEWNRCRSDFNKVWAEIYAKNHYKSLDHRSFYFKQQDSKNLSTKSLVAEIKEIKEKLQKEDHIIQSIAAENRQPLIPHLEFEYSDGGIHEDLYKLVQYSCEEVFSSKELLNKIMRLWSTFLEPMLGVTSQSHGTERVEDRKAGHSSRNFAASNVGGDGSPHRDSISTNSRLPKSDKNEVDGRVTEVKNIHRTSVAANDKENGSVGGELVCRDDQLMDKGLKKVECSDKASGFSKQFASDEQGVKNNPSIAIRGENSLNRTNLDVSPGCVSAPSRPTDADDSVAKSQTVNLPLVEGGDIAAPVPVANGVLVENSKVKSHEESSGPCKVEKEEGELSPNGDSEEDNFVAYGDSNAQSMAKSKHNIERRKYESRDREEECGPETGGDNDADADDEDSENVSEAGEDVSGSESAGDECFREDHEEDDIEHDDVDGKAESEGEAEGMCDAQGGGDGSSLPLSERFLSSVKPLTKHVSAVSFAEEMKDSRVFYGNDDFYVLFRLHQILYERILSAKTNSMSAEMKWKAKVASSPDPYSRFMNALYNLLDGSAENSKFEDKSQAINGNQSFTLDILIYKLIRQLQTVATDDKDSKLLQLYEFEKSRKPGKLNESVYHANAHVILHEENIYRFQCSSTPPRLSIQLMDYMNEKPELSAVSIDPNFSFYLHNDFLSVLHDKKEPHCILLQRNKDKYGKLDDLSAICSAMEGVKVINGLECKTVCNSSKGYDIAALVPVANGVCRQLLGILIPFLFIARCNGEDADEPSSSSSWCLITLLVIVVIFVVVVLRDLSAPTDPMPPIDPIPMEGFERLGTQYDPIAEGRSGTVYKGTFGTRPAAIKRVVNRSIAKNEIQALLKTRRGNCPNIIKYFTHEWTLEARYIAMERCGCTLSDFIYYFSDTPFHPAISNTSLQFLNLVERDKSPVLLRPRRAPSPLLLSLMKQIVDGLSELHHEGIVHRDLKPNSILVTRNPSLRVKIAGMSNCKLLHHIGSFIGSNVVGRGTSGWQPREVINGEPQTCAVDTFSLGCVLYFCMSGGYHPFGIHDREANILSGTTNLTRVSPIAQDLISKLVEDIPSTRLNLNEVLLHPLFWDTRKKLDFLQEVYEHLKICAYSNIVVTDCDAIDVGTDWSVQLSTFVRDYLRNRNYVFQSPVELLKAIRNLSIHLPSLPSNIKTMLGPTRHDFYGYFDSRYPYFFINVYKVISYHWSTRAEFGTYFRDESDL